MVVILQQCSMIANQQDLVTLASGASIPPTVKALFPQLPPFPFPSAVSPPVGFGAKPSPSGVGGEAPADIDFGVF